MTEKKETKKIYWVSFKFHVITGQTVDFFEVNTESTTDSEKLMVVLNKIESSIQNEDGWVGFATEDGTEFRLKTENIFSYEYRVMIEDF